MNKKIKEIIEALEFMCKTGDVSKIALESLKNGLEELDEQLNLSGVSHSKVFEAYGKPFTSGRDLWDWLNDNCDIRLKT